VLDSVSLQQPVGTVVHHDGEIHDDLVLRFRQNRAHHRVQLDHVGGLAELGARHLEQVHSIAHIVFLDAFGVSG
jgi:hypothetical protein